jgi:hypothetical protein
MTNAIQRVNHHRGPHQKATTKMDIAIDRTEARFDLDMSQDSTMKTKTSPSVIKRSLSAAFRGGIAGFVAMILQVILLMWLRTVVNFQYRNNAGILEAFQTLWEEGGLGRFYQGITFALLMGPISRFGDSAANEGMKDLLKGTTLKLELITLCASFAASVWRIILTPMDNLKTNMQVWGKSGIYRTFERAHTHGFWTMYSGALGNWGASIVGHYSWFAVNNRLEVMIPSSTGTKTTRRAFIGLCAAVVSDCISNGIRVVKTYKQTAEVPMSYSETISELFQESGFVFVFRGLGVKLISNVLSSILFSILWKKIMDHLQARNSGDSSGGPMRVASIKKSAHN